MRANLHAMSPDRFEALIGELLIQMGVDGRPGRCAALPSPLASSA